MAAQDKEEILANIMERLEKVGDLPIFSASVNRVQMVGSDPDADAMALAMEVLKDANLTTKVLKLANSSYYNRGVIKVGALSRAIVMLGFNVVKSTVLTMKLIESFQQDNPDIDMNSLLVNSFMSAGFIREVATECGSQDVELSYICGLLHNLGDVITAYTMPEKYVEMKQLASNEEVSWPDAQKKILGISLLDVGQGVVEKWSFPTSVSKTIAPHTGKVTKVGGDKVEFNRSLATLTNRMMDLLYSDNPVTTQSLSDITGELSDVSGVSTDLISNCLEKSFKQAHDLAAAYGLDKKQLMPKMRANSDDEYLYKVARKLSYYGSNKNEGAKSEEAFLEEEMVESDDGYDEAPETILDPDSIVSTEVIEPVVKEGGDVNVFLGILHELTTMMTQKTHLNAMFTKVLEGMNVGVGFDRALLCLLTPDHKKYVGRVAVGESADELKEYFEVLPINESKDLFSKLIMQGSEILVSDINQGNWQNMLPEDFSESLNTTSFLIAALRVRGKPLGMFYVDKFQKKTAISAEDQRGFMQLVAQAQLALQLS